MLVLLLPAVSAEENLLVDKSFEGAENRILVVINADSRIPHFNQAAENTNLSVYMEAHSGKTISSDFNVSGYDLVLFGIVGPATYERIKPISDSAKEQGIKTVVISEGAYGIIADINLTSNATEINELYEYWDNGGVTNTERLIQYMCVKFLSVDEPILPPVPMPSNAVYHPDIPEFYSNVSEFIAWSQSEGMYDPLKPTVVVFTYDSRVKTEDTGGEDAIIRELESRGYNSYAAFYDRNNPDYTSLLYHEGDLVPEVVVYGRSFAFNQKGEDHIQAFLRQVNLPLIKVSIVGLQNTSNYLSSPQGLASSALSYEIIQPEMDGAIEMIWLAGRDDYPEDGITRLTPIPEQVEYLADRVEGWLNLRLTPNSEKKVAMVYYNYPPGKQNIGASYLAVVPSMVNILQSMDNVGYEVGSVPATEDELLDALLSRGRNIGTWAPGSMEEMVRQGQEDGSIVLLDLETYQEWFSELPPTMREDVIDQWGEAPGNIMVYEGKIVLPVIRYGNIILAPQPDRAWLSDDSKIYHSFSLAPTHQYIAFYLWLQKSVDEGGYGADAVVHMGRHGTHEFLPGRERTLSPMDDWGPVLLGKMPNIYPYIVDGIGEGTTAKRRGNAVIIDHLTPPLGNAQLYAELSDLHDLMHLHYKAESDEMRDQYRQSIQEKLIGSTILEDLNLTTDEVSAYNDTQFQNFIDGRLHPYLHELEDQVIPLGLHVLGIPPQGDMMFEMVLCMVRTDLSDAVMNAQGWNRLQMDLEGGDELVSGMLYELLINGTSVSQSQQNVLGYENPSVASLLETSLIYAAALNDCAVEMDALLNALNGGYVPPGLSGDPVRKPDILPTGKNFYSFDSRSIPTKQAWNVAIELNEQFLEDYFQKHGRYPEKVAFVLFAGETMRHDGVMEARIMHMMGIRPHWDRNNRATDVVVIPEHELGRPRIDVVVTTSGLYRDIMSDRMELLDRAVKAAIAAGETTYPNYVSRHTDSTRNALIDAGYSPEDAERFASVRIFSSESGNYGTGVANLVDASDVWNDTDEIVNLYLDRMSYAYGQGMWGEKNIDVFRYALSGTEVAMHSRSTNLYGVLDNNDIFQYLGALGLAVKSIDGSQPEMYIVNLRNTGNVYDQSLEDFLRMEMRARYLNPQWVSSMMNSGYEGARQIDEIFGNMWGWDVTTNVISDSMWQQMYDVYVNDRYDLGLNEWFNENSPWAKQSMLARMLEAERKGYWTISDEIIQNIVKEYVESIAENGVTCCHHTCGNPTLDKYVNGIMSVPGVVSEEAAADYNKKLFEATHRTTQVDPGVTEQRYSSGRSTGEARISESGSGNQTIESTAGYGTDLQAEQAIRSTQQDNYVEGYEMTRESVEKETGSMTFSAVDMMGIIVALAVFGLIAYGWKKRR